VLAEKFLTAESDSGQRLKLAFRMLISREPTDTELAVLTGLIDKERSEFREKLDDAAQYLSIGESPRNTTLDVAEHAALTAVIQAIMNYDEFMSKR
jgi:phosphoribosylformylglycinamidine (FGAM) synthase-like enzyme